MPEIEVDGLRLTYERTGEGPPLLLLHGGIGEGHGTWGPQLDGLSDAFTVVAWDAPGAGGSDDPPEDFTLADFADCLAGFVKALALGRPHVAGLSFGAGLALELLRRQPALPRTLILVSGYAGWAGSLGPDDIERRLRLVLELADLPPDRYVGQIMPTLFSDGTPAETVTRFGANASAFHPVGLRAMARSFAAADLRDVLPRVDVPTLLLYGDLDVRAPVSVAERLHAAIPASRLVVLPGVGHVVNLEAPERFDAEARAFLAVTPRA